MYAVFIAYTFTVGVVGGVLAAVAAVQSRRERAARQNRLGQSREPRPPLPRRDTDWQRLTDLQNKARAEIDQAARERGNAKGANAGDARAFGLHTRMPAALDADKETDGEGKSKVL